MRLPYPMNYVAVGAATLLYVPVIAALRRISRPRAAHEKIQAWSRVTLDVCGTDWSAEGVEHVPRGSGCVIMSNHRSHLDGPTLLLVLPEPIYFVIKKELTRIPVWGWGAVKAGFIPVDRTDADSARHAIGSAVDRVQKGDHVLVFPEGTRSGSKRMLDFKKGGFHLAIDAQAPIVPVAILGSDRVLPRSTPRPTPGVIHVRVGAPIPTIGLGKADIPELLLLTRKRISEMLDDPGP